MIHNVDILVSVQYCSGTVYAVIYEVDNTKNRSELLRGMTHA